MNELPISNFPPGCPACDLSSLEQSSETSQYLRDLRAETEKWLSERIERRHRKALRFNSKPQKKPIAKALEQHTLSVVPPKQAASLVDKNCMTTKIAELRRQLLDWVACYLLMVSSPLTADSFKAWSTKELLVFYKEHRIK